MEFEQLKEKALSLPLSPGVYIMRDKNDRVIYVGKAKKLKNRVSQYFQDTASHSPKTRIMVSKIHHFDVIVAASEFESLILECSLIKRYLPRYNILLKDDKGFPYVRIEKRKDYPKITMVNRIEDDDAEYFGPFGSRGVTTSLLEAIRICLKLPNCNRQFPKDIGKGRPCLNYHMNQCSGWCQPGKTAEEYLSCISQARQLLQGKYKEAAESIRQSMLDAAEELNFELAASLRDRLNAVTALGQKQLVTAGKAADTDVIGFSQDPLHACFTVLHYQDGNLLDKEYEILSSQDDPQAAVSSLVKQYYLNRGYTPREVLLPFGLDDGELFEKMLFEQFGRKTTLRVPQRGDNAKLVALAQKNAFEEVARISDKREKLTGALNLLKKALKLEQMSRMESFDISNISGTDIVASMVVFQDGKPKKSEYKRFQIRDLVGQDDYASMYQVILRRFTHFKNQDKGFQERPDVLLIDGGVTHAQTAVKALNSLGLWIPVFGMVKDNKHRTRALVTPEGEEIRIDHQPSVFSLIGSIQEETHRFAIAYHRNLRSKRLKASCLDNIPGIGPKRKQELLKVFRSVSAISKASEKELGRVLPQSAAAAVYAYFQSNQEGNDESCE